jgi:hypothetical protein
MSHAVHELPRRIFGDDCEECVERASTIRGLTALDGHNIVKLGDLAREIYRSGGKVVPAGVSFADEQAVENLRLAGRVVFASGITEETAR